MYIIFINKFFYQFKKLKKKRGGSEKSIFFGPPLNFFKNNLYLYPKNISVVNFDDRNSIAFFIEKFLG